MTAAHLIHSITLAYFLALEILATPEDANLHVALSLAALACCYRMLTDTATAQVTTDEDQPQDECMYTGGSY